MALFAEFMILVSLGDKTTYIIAFTKPVDDNTYKQARTDIEASGGQVDHEIRSGLAGMIVKLPSDQFNTFSSKPYVDFMEKDQEGIEPFFFLTDEMTRTQAILLY